MLDIAKSKKLKIIYDMMLNICASALPIVILQLIVFPRTASILGEEDYGLMLTLVSLTSMISLSLGNVLNNVRLLRQNEYAEMSVKGDFNLLLAVFTAINTLIIVIAAGLYTSFNISQIFYTLIASILMLLKNYVSVWFRIELNYKKVLIDNIFLLIGYYVGFYLFVILRIWQLIYIGGYLFSCIYILQQYNLLKEPWVKTKNFTDRINDSVSLSAATVISSALSYIDKLLLYPMLGGAAVSIYYSASIIGKMCSMLVTPVSSVMLSYLAKLKNFRRKLFFQMVAMVGGIAFVAYFACLLISAPLLTWMYPEWAASSMEIIKITTATAMLTLAVSVLNPVVLKFCKLNRQIMINAVSLIAYLTLCLVLLKINGLAGFAFGVFAATAIKLIFIIIVFLVDYNPNEI